MRAVIYALCWLADRLDACLSRVEAMIERLR